MTKYEQLLCEANNLGVVVKEIDLGNNIPCGRCIGNVIIINSNIEESEKYCVLCEELGHYHLTVGNITNQNNILNKKQELLARKWGYKKNAGLLKLIEAFNAGCRSRHEIAEFLNVTEEYLNEAIEYYTSKYGAYYTIDCYNIMFIPNFRIGKSFF